MLRLALHVEAGRGRVDGTIPTSGGFKLCTGWPRARGWHWHKVPPAGLFKGLAAGAWMARFETSRRRDVGGPARARVAGTLKRVDVDTMLGLRPRAWMAPSRRREVSNFARPARARGADWANCPVESHGSRRTRARMELTKLAANYNRDFNLRPLAWFVKDSPGCKTGRACQILTPCAG